MWCSVSLLSTHNRESKYTLLLSLSFHLQSLMELSVTSVFFLLAMGNVTICFFVPLPSTYNREWNYLSLRLPVTYSREWKYVSFLQPSVYMQRRIQLSVASSAFLSLMISTATMCCFFPSCIYLQFGCPDVSVRFRDLCSIIAILTLFTFTFLDTKE